eukprot:164445-Pyramimonas_sp.AAC.1
MQNAMLRRIVVCSRKPEEPWVEWMQRTTRKARSSARHSAVQHWVVAHFRRKWRWAGHLARMHHQEWAGEVTRWRDLSWQASVVNDYQRPLRPLRWPWMKFESSMKKFCFAC